MGEVLFIIGIILLLTVVPVVIEVICINFFIDAEDGCLTLIFAIISGLVIICAIIGSFIYNVKYGIFSIVGYAVLFIIVFFIQWLVTGGPADAKEKKLKNKLLDAINNHDKETVQKLIENGVDVKYWESPLKVAVENSDKEMVSFLIEKGANVNFKYHDGSMEYLLDYTTDEEMIDVLRKHGAKTREEWDVLNADLFSAIGDHNKERAEFLISQGADVNYVRSISDIAEGIEDVETTPLMLAVYENNIEMVKLLVKNGADIRKQLRSGVYNYQTLYNDAINFAKSKGFMDIVNFLEHPYSID